MLPHREVVNPWQTSPAEQLPAEHPVLKLQPQGHTLGSLFGSSMSLWVSTQCAHDADG